MVALGITKEIIQGVKSTLAVVITVMLTYISAAHLVVNRSIRGRLLRMVIGAMACMILSIIGSRVVMHLAIVVIVAASIGCKVLQVSDCSKSD